MYVAVCRTSGTPYISKRNSDFDEKIARAIPSASALCECCRDNAMRAGVLFSVVNAIEDFLCAASCRSNRNLYLSEYFTLENAAPIIFVSLASHKKPISVKLAVLFE